MRNSKRRSKTNQKALRWLTFGSLCFILLFIQIGVSEAAESYSKTYGSGRKLLQSTADTLGQTADWLHAIPRKALNGSNVEPTVFLVDGLQYYSALASVLIFAIAIGIVGIAVGISFCCCRFFCNLCGGKEPKDSGYTQAERNVVKVLLIIDVVLLVALIVIGCVGNSWFGPGLTDFFQNIETETVPQVELLRSIEPRLLAVTNRTNLKGYVAAITGDANATETATNNGRGAIGENDGARLSVLGITYGVIALAGLMGVIAALGGIPRLSMAAAGFGFFAFFLCWLNLAVHFPVSMIVSDLCYDLKITTLDGVINERVSRIRNPDGALNLIVHCPNVNNSIRTYGWAQQLINESIDAQNNLFVVSGGNLTANDSIEYNRLEAQKNTLALIQQDVIFIRDCRWLEYIFNPITDAICGNNLTGLVYIWAVSFTHSLLLIPFIVLTIVGFKRFSKMDAGVFF